MPVIASNSIKELECYTCGGKASIEVTEEGGRTVAYVDCACGVITALRSSGDAEKVIKDITKQYTVKKPRKLIKKTGLKSCFCGSSRVEIVRFEDKSVYVICYDCYRTTDELNDDGTYKTEEQAIELWNREAK